MTHPPQKITDVDAGLSSNDPIRNLESEIRLLLQFSARIGRDPLLVQASSGNTSLKLNGTLWIKASGKWLAKADQENVLVPVSVSECLECLKDKRPITTCYGSLERGCLIPSVETLMHAVLPQRCVVHVHSVDTLAWAVRSDATVQLAERLCGLRWKWIPYVPSGLPLALEIQNRSSTCPHSDVFILGNHGLVVCGESCEAAEFMLAEVQRRLAIQSRPAVRWDVGRLEPLRDLSSWRLPTCEALHSLGTDTISHKILKKGILYPCQAMFLGRRLTLLQRSENLSSLANRVDQLSASSPVVIIEGTGVLINNNITPAADAVLRGFAEVVRRIDAQAPIRYLTDDEVNTIMSVYAQPYRRSAEDSAP